MCRCTEAEARASAAQCQLASAGERHVALQSLQQEMDMTRAQQRDALAESQHLIVLAEGRADDAEASLGKARASGQGVETSLAAAQRQVWEANERLAEQEKFAVQQEVRLKQREMSQEGAIRKLVTEADSMALRLRQAEEEGLADTFMAAGFEWREPGCSMCLAMNADRLNPGERCASTSNRNFEGRQGRGGRTHLVSPAMAAAAAVNGHFIDVRDL